MVRFVIIGIVIAVAFTLYALVDAAMTDGARARGVAKPVWVVLVVVLPVIGALLWFTIGKGSEAESVRKAPDDDPRFTGNHLSDADLDAHMRDLEARLRELDDEVFPGEPADGASDGTGVGNTVAGGKARGDVSSDDLPDLGADGPAAKGGGSQTPGKTGGTAGGKTGGPGAAGGSGKGGTSGAAGTPGTAGTPGASGADAGSADRPETDRP